MKQLLIRPVILEYETMLDFAKEFQIEEEDVIITNEYIYEPLIKGMQLKCNVLFQEKYGTGEPTDIMVDAILSEISQMNCKRIIAIGGGTIIDIAKILALDNAEAVDALYQQKLLSKNKTLIIIPTTCGTGSEVTNISIINRTRIHTKMGLTGEAMYADYAVLIPEFLNSLPYYVFATSSIDALIHAVESYLSPNRTPYTELFSEAAIQEILQCYCKIAENGQEVWKIYRKELLRASNYAGIAFGNSGCAAVHAMSYALGSKYHVAHGESNYQFFIEVLKLYDKKHPNGKIKKLKHICLEVMYRNQFIKAKENQDAFCLLEVLLEEILKRKYMKEYGAGKEDVEEFAISTMKNQQRLLKNNYIPLTLEEIEAIYAKRLG